MQGNQGLENVYFELARDFTQLILSFEEVEEKEYEKIQKTLTNLEMEQLPAFEEIYLKSQKDAAFLEGIAINKASEMADPNLCNIYKIGLIFFGIVGRIMCMSKVFNNDPLFRSLKDRVIELIDAIKILLLDRETGPDIVDSFSKSINEVANEIINESKVLEINYKLNILRIKLRDILGLNKTFEKIGEDKSSRIKRSVIDKTRPITNDLWVLSLVRKPDGTHPEHAFLILEGRENDEIFIWFIDLVGNPIIPGMSDGKVRFFSTKGNLEEDLLFLCKLRMMDIRKGDRILSSSWNVTKISANQLLEDVEKEKSHPPKFNILGNKSIFAIGTGTSSSIPVGHNCFTWAKEKIRNLNDPHIFLPENDLQSWLYSATSRYLSENNFNRYRIWYQKPEVIIPVVTVTATIGTAITIANSEQIAETVFATCKIQ